MLSNRELHFEGHEPTRALLVSLLQPLESLVPLAKTDVDEGKVKGRNILSLRAFFQFVEVFHRLFGISGKCVRLSDGAFVFAFCAGEIIIVITQNESERNVCFG